MKFLKVGRTFINLDSVSSIMMIGDYVTVYYIGETELKDSFRDDEADALLRYLNEHSEVAV